MEGNLATIPIGAAVVTDASFAKGKHVIDFQVFSGSAVIGAGKSCIVTKKNGIVSQCITTSFQQRYSGIFRC